MQAIKTELLELLRRNDLLRATLLVGKILDANFPVDFHFERVMEFAAGIWHRCRNAKKDPILKAQAINDLLFGELGLTGKSDKHKNVFDDPDRYYLHLVLEKKAGSNLTLAILYSILADQVGLEHECVALPSNILLKVRDVASDFYIDPFDGGKFLNQDDFHKKFRSVMQRSKLLSASLYERLDSQQLMAKLVQQLKQIYILKGKAPEALRAVEILTCLVPNSPELTRDRGILYCEIEYFSKAMEDLRYYLSQRPNASDVGEIRKLTTMLKGCREIVN